MRYSDRSDLRVLIESFLHYLEFRRGYSRNTVISYKSDVTAYIRYLCDQGFSSKSLVEPDSYQFLSFLTSISNNTKTRMRYFSSIKHFFSFLEEDGGGQKINGLFPKVKFPSLPQYSPSVLDDHELKRLLMEASSGDTPMAYRDTAMIEMMYSCGLRVSEITDLTFKEMDFDESWVTVRGKGNKQRILPIGSLLRYRLEKYFQHGYPLLSRNRSYPVFNSQQPLFLTRFGKSFSRVSIWKIIKKYAKKAHIKSNVYPHTLRHTFATHLLFNGADLRVIQVLLGHNSIATTQIYTHLKKEELLETIQKYHPLSNENFVIDVGYDGRTRGLK